VNDTIECLEHGADCVGEVEYRHPLSGTGRSFPRCEYHWDKRLDKQDEFNRRDADARKVNYLDAGERYYED
jgi:hypothetical protein